MKSLAVLALAALPLLAAEPLTYPCHRAAVAPAIDGKVTADPGWRGIPRVTGFNKLGSDYTVAKQSIAMACWDDEALTIAMVCEEPDAGKLKPVVKDGGQTWTEDSVEIFVQPDPKNSPFQIGVTCGGAKGAGAGSPEIAKCQAAAFIGKDVYELELRIPYAAIGATRPADSATWRISFCRNIWTTDSGGDKFTCWAPLQSRFLEPENFGLLVFHESKLSPVEVGRLDMQASADYRRVLSAKVRAAAAKADEFLADLAAAERDKRFAGRAGTLAGQWRALRDVAKHAESADPVALRASVCTLDTLVADSHTLKYTYLLEKLFDGE